METIAPVETRPPRLRRELEFTHRRVGDEAEVIVCDPLSGRYFRAGELEAALFALLDGERPVEEIGEQLARDFPGFEAEEVPEFVGYLDRLGFLEGSQAAGKRPRLPLYRRLIFAQLRLADPDGLFARLLPYVGWLYRPVGWAIAAALLLVAGVVAMGSREDLALQLAEAHTPAFWLRFWIGLSLIGTIHEFGHGLTCKFFGGRTTGVGLLWMYGVPCFYCDVTGAWTLPLKSQRLWVSAAGLYYQFLAGAVALLLWRVLEPGTLVSNLLLAMAASCSVLSFFNLNPLLKLDGYYLLSDGLEIPNLRQRSFRALGARLGRFWFGNAPEAEPAEEGFGERGRWVERVCLVYGTLASLFLVYLLSRLFNNLGGFFIGRLGGTGALLFLALAGMAFGTPLARALKAFGRRLARWKEIPMTARRRLIAAGGGLTLGVVVLTVGRWDLRLTSPCKLDAAARAWVRAGTDGRVAELTTREGGHVRRGQMVGHLATFERLQRRAELEHQLRMTRLEIEALSDRLPIVAAETEKGAAEAATGAQEARTQLAEEREMLPSRVLEARQHVDTARADLQASRSLLEEARAAVQAESLIAVRKRGDARRAAAGDDPPILAAARELSEQKVVEREAAQREYERLRLLVSDGAVSQQQVDIAKSRYDAAGRGAEEARQEFEKTSKNLREEAEDAEAELQRRQAALDAARAAEASKRSALAAAEAQARQVAAASTPARIETARLRAAGGVAGQHAALAARRELAARGAEIHMKRQEAGRLATRIAVLSDQLRRSDLLAPCDGVVTTPRVEDLIGAHFDEGASIIEVEDPRSLFTRIFVNEKDLGEVRVGRPVALRVAAFPQRLYRGRVSEIAPQAAPNGSAAFPTNTVEVRLWVENPTGELRPGMSGWAKIDCGPRPLGAILLRRVSRYLRTEVWSWF